MIINTRFLMNALIIIKYRSIASLASGGGENATATNTTGLVIALVASSALRTIRGEFAHSIAASVLKLLDCYLTRRNYNKNKRTYTKDSAEITLDVGTTTRLSRPVITVNKQISKNVMT